MNLRKSEISDIESASDQVRSDSFGKYWAGSILIFWTFLVWVGRVRNILADEILVGWPRTWRLALAGSFVALALGAVVCLALVFRPKGGCSGRAHKRYQRWLLALAFYGIVVWLVRGTGIAFGDYDLAFKLVHSVLAAGTIVLGLIVIKRTASLEEPQASLER